MHWTGFRISTTSEEVTRWANQKLDRSQGKLLRAYTSAELAALPAAPNFYWLESEMRYREGWESGFDYALELVRDLYASGGFVRTTEITNILFDWSDRVVRPWRYRDGTGDPFSKYSDNDAPVEISFRHESWAGIRQRILRRDRCCVSCRDVIALEVDHIVPVQDGGLPTDDNLQTLCSVCHKKKSRARASRRNTN